MPLSPADVAADERLRLLHTAIAEMFASLDLDHRIRTMATAARHLQTAEASAVLLRDDDEDALVIRAHEGLSDDYAKRQRIPMAAAQASYPGPDSHIVVDLRHNVEFEAEPESIVGALRLSPDELEVKHDLIPRDRDVILYCT